MTIVQLEYFLAVVNRGSFSLAAEHCFVTQPSLSMQIKRLEEELGVVLLDRTRQPVVPTDMGVLVAENAREALRGFYRVREVVDQARGVVAGRIEVGVIPTIAPYLLPRFVPEFEARYPDVELRIREMSAVDMSIEMCRDALDCGIVAAGTCGGDLVEQELFDDRFFVYVSPNHRLFERENVRIEDVGLGDLYVLREGHCLRDQVLELFAGKGCGTMGVEGNSLETLMRLVDAGGGMTVIPEMAVDFVPEERKGQVKMLSKGAAGRKIVMVSRRGYVKGELVEAMKKVLVDE